MMAQFGTPELGVKIMVAEQCYIFDLDTDRVKTEIARLGCHSLIWHPGTRCKNCV
jgi:hypothetical protein